MPKATLSFTLPEEQSDFDTAIGGGKYRSALDALANAFRAKAKYEEVQATTWEEARELFWQTLRDEEVEL